MNPPFHSGPSFPGATLGGIPFLFALFILLAAVLIFFSYWSAKKRREELAQLAGRLGLRFSPDKDYGLAQRYAFLGKLAQGDNRYAYNLLQGLFQSFSVQVFDYHFETHSTDGNGHRQTHHHTFSFFILELPRDFPELTVAPEGFLSKIAQAFGYDDIDFESAEFSRLFCVRSPDKKFAYDVCNPQMIDYLLNQTDIAFEIEHSALALSAQACLTPAQIEFNLGRLVHLRSLLPEYLFDRP